MLNTKMLLRDIRSPAFLLFGEPLVDKKTEAYTHIQKLRIAIIKANIYIEKLPF